MVLQPNFAKRNSNAENRPPTLRIRDSTTKRLALGIRSSLSGVRSSVSTASRRRRARTNGGSRAPEYAAKQAKRRSETKSPASNLQFNVASITTAPTPVADVEMTDVATPTIQTIPVVLPRELRRPEYCEISKESLKAAASHGDPSVAEVDIEYIRDELEKCGPTMFRSLTTVEAHPLENSLPKELAIIVNDAASWSNPPTHMMAVHGPPTRGGPRRVSLFPVHSLVLAAHCAKLPPLPPSTSTTPSGQPGSFTVPVRPLCIPSPETYPLLTSYLYNKRTDILLASLFPTPPPEELEDDPSLIQSFAMKLGGTYTAQALLQHTVTVHGLWKNVCALGIFVDDLWDTMDLAWEVLLTALAIGTGSPHLMLNSSSTASTSSSSS